MLEQNRKIEVELDEYIKESVAWKLQEVVNEGVAKEVDKRFAQFKWTAAVIGIIGIGTFGTLANYGIEKAVESRIEKQTGKISDSFDFLKFYALTLKLQFSDGFIQEDVDSVLNYTRRAKENADVRNSPEFTAALVQVLISLAAASQSAAIDELFESYQNEIVAAPSLVQPLLHHYGQRIVARLHVPEEDFDYRAFERLERVAEASRVSSLAMAYRTLFEASSDLTKPQASVAALIKASASLDDREKMRYLNEILLRSRWNNWIKRTTPEGDRLQEIVRALFVTYEAEFSSIYKIPLDTSKAIGAEGVDEQNAELLAIQYSVAGNNMPHAISNDDSVLPSHEFLEPSLVIPSPVPALGTNNDFSK